MKDPKHVKNGRSSNAWSTCIESGLLVFERRDSREAERGSVRLLWKGTMRGLERGGAYRHHIGSHPRYVSPSVCTV